MPSKISQRIVITGANGFIGSHLVNFLNNSGYQVLALYHTEPKIKINSVNYNYFDLSKGLMDDSLIEKNDIIIHCAYNKLANIENDNNTHGMELFINECKKHEVKKHIFFSSISAKEKTSSYYGTHKYLATRFFDHRDAILTTGLVIGHGGVFNSTLSFIRKTGFIPTLKGGTQPIYFVSIDEVAETVGKIIEEDLSGSYLVANTNPINYITFYKSASKMAGIKNKQLNISIPIMKFFIYLNSFLKKPYITQENLKGLIELNYLEDMHKLQTNIVNYSDLPTIFKQYIENGAK